jgi:hypothetical protein
MTTRTIDRKTGVPGLGKALVTIGWLTEGDDGVTVSRFDEHNGASSKQRAQTAKRVSNHKANAKVTPDALPKTDDAVTAALPREDKNKEQLPPIPPKGGDQIEEPEAPEPRRKAAISLKTHMDECRKAGAKSIPEGHAVFAYAAKVGIPEDFLRLHWLEFKDRYTMPESKRYKAWPTVFHKSVKGNWFKLWFVNGNGQYVLTTVGQQAQRSHAEAA